MTVYITKYALTDGIIKADDARDCRSCEGMIHVSSIGSQAYFHGEGKQWHKTLESAKAKAEQMRVKKIDSLKKQIAKLEKLDFTNNNQ